VFYWPQLDKILASATRRPIYLHQLLISIPQVKASAQLQFVDGSIFFSVSDLILSFTKVRRSLDALCLTVIANSTLFLQDIEAKALFVLPDKLLQALGNYFLSQALKQSPSLVGSLDIIGNPTQLVRNFSNGIRDFFVMPISFAATRGPLGLLEGVVKGSGSLVGHVTGGVLQSVSGFSQSVARLIDPERQGLLYG